VKVLDEGTLIDEMRRYFGAAKATRLLGWMVLSMLQLPADAQDEYGLVHYGWGSRATRYRAVADLREFRRDLERRGWRVPAESAGQARAVALVAV